MKQSEGWGANENHPPHSRDPAVSPQPTPSQPDTRASPGQSRRDAQLAARPRTVINSVAPSGVPAAVDLGPSRTDSQHGPSSATPG